MEANNLMKRIGDEILQDILLLVLGMATVFVFNIVQQVVLAYYCTIFFTQYLYDWFHTSNPLILGLGWGIVGSWWVGLPFSIVFVLAARAGSWPQRNARQIVPIAAVLVGVLWLTSLISGIIGHATAQAFLNFDNNSWLTMFYPSLIRDAVGDVSSDTFLRLGAAQFANSYAYLFGSAGAIFVTGLVLGQRWGLQHAKRFTKASASLVVQETARQW